MFYLSLHDIIEKLTNFSSSIQFAPHIIPYWKRTFAFHVKSRYLQQQEINNVIKGKIYGNINNQKVSFSAGDVFWIGPNVPHSLVWEKDLIYYSFRFSIIANNEKITIDQPYLSFENTQDLELLFQKIVRVKNNLSENKFSSYKLHAYFLLLVLELYNLKMNSTNKNFGRKLNEGQQEILQGYCLKNKYANNISSKTLSKLFNYSQDYFSRIFKNTYNKNVRSWVYEERMKYAAQFLIDSDLPFYQIAEILGYVDIYLFNRQFKKVMNLTPKQYREMHRFIYL